MSQLNTSAQPRKVFSSPSWDVDHEIISVTNDGDCPITVRAWIDSPSDNDTATVDPGTTKTISTPSVLTQKNQILVVGFDAYDNGTSIDSYKATLAVGATSTPLPTTARSPGFIGPLALICLIGGACLALRKGR